MGRTIALLYAKPTSRSRLLLGMMEEGINACGDHCIWVEDTPRYKSILNDCDAAVQVYFPNLSSAQKGFRRLAYDYLIYELDRPVLTIETGFFKNQSEFEIALGLQQKRIEDKSWFNYESLKGVRYALGWNGIKGDADYALPAPPVPSSRRESLGVDLKPYRKDGNHILVIGQTLNGVSTHDTSVNKWYADVTKELAKHSDRPVLFRYHPRVTKVREGGVRHSDTGRRELRKLLRGAKFSEGKPLDEDLRRCWGVVSLTSNAAAYCAVSGVPVHTPSRRSICWPVRVKSVAELVSSPTLADREEWLNKLSWCQWSLEEIATGAAWRHVARDLAAVSPSNSKPFYS